MTTEYVKPEKEMITITKEEYNNLLKNSKFLNHLYAFGVDEWEGYSSAREIMIENINQ